MLVGLLRTIGRIVGLVTGAYLVFVAARGSRLLVRPEVRPFAPEWAGAPATPADTKENSREWAARKSDVHGNPFGVRLPDPLSMSEMSYVSKAYAVTTGAAIPRTRARGREVCAVRPSRPAQFHSWSSRQGAEAGPV